MSPAAAAAPPATAAGAENPSAVRWRWGRRRRWYSARWREQEAVEDGDALEARGVDVRPVRGIARLFEVASCRRTAAG